MESASRRVRGGGAGLGGATGPVPRVLAPVIAGVLAFSAGGIASASEVLFSDDFEDGTCEDQWVRGGRQQGICSASVETRHGSMMAHLHKEYFTEIDLCRDFGYEKGLRFRWDMEVQVYSETGAPSNYYGLAGVQFIFLDAAGTGLGSVGYIAATTDFPFQAGSTNNRLANGSYATYEFSGEDLLGSIGLDGDSVTTVRMRFVTYSSTWPFPDVVLDVWLDNVTVLREGTAFRRGDASDDGVIDISDPIAVLGYLFLGTGEVRCPKAGDANGDGHFDISDAAYLLSYLFLSGEAPPPPSPGCGLDSPGNDLACDSYTSCP